MKECIHLDQALTLSNLQEQLGTFDSGAGTFTDTDGIFVGGDVGKHIVYKTLTGYESGRFEITAVNSANEVDVDVLQAGAHVRASAGPQGVAPLHASGAVRQDGRRRWDGAYWRGGRSTLEGVRLSRASDPALCHEAQRIACKYRSVRVGNALRDLDSRKIGRVVRPLESAGLGHRFLRDVPQCWTAAPLDTSNRS